MVRVLLQPLFIILRVSSRSTDDDFPPPPPRRKPRDSLNHPLSRPPLRPETISQPGSSNVAGSFNPIRPFISHRPVMTAPVASSPKRPASGASGSSSSGPSERPLNVARKSTGVQRLKGPREKLSSPALGSSSKLPAGKTPKESHAPSARSRDNAQKPSSSGSDDFPHVRDILRKSISTQPRKLSTPVASSSKVPSVCTCDTLTVVSDDLILDILQLHSRESLRMHRGNIRKLFTNWTKIRGQLLVLRVRYQNAAKMNVS